MRLLVIEDNAAARDELAATLASCGHTCEPAATVDGALLALASGEWDGCVLDLLLDRDATALHAALASRRVPVLLVSGAEPSRLPAVAREHGWSWLAKPWEPDALVAAVTRLLEGGGRADISGTQSAIRRDPDGRVTATKSTAQVVGVTIRSSGSLEIFAGAVLASTSTGSFASGNWIRFSRVGGILSVFSGTGASLSAVTWTFRGSVNIQTGALQTVLTSSLGCYTAAPSSPPLTSDVGPIYERSK